MIQGMPKKSSIVNSLYLLSIDFLITAKQRLFQTFGLPAGIKFVFFCCCNALLSDLNDTSKEIRSLFLKNYVGMLMRNSAKRAKKFKLFHSAHRITTAPIQNSWEPHHVSNSIEVENYLSSLSIIRTAVTS